MESQDSRSDAVEAAHEGLVLAMVEQLERNATNFHQEEYALDNPIGLEASISNVDVDTDVPNVVEFQVWIGELKNIIHWLHNVSMKEWLHNLRLKLNKSNFWLRKLKSCLNMPKP